MAEPELQELKANLGEYKEQLQQLEELLLDEPDNEDYQSLYADVREAISLTEQALRDYGSANDAAEAPADPLTSAPGTSAAPEAPRKRKSRFDAGTSKDGVSGTNPSALPQQVVDQIRYAKARSALEGRAPAGWALGYDCLARGPSGKWEPGRVVSVTPEGNFKVEFEGQDGQAEEVHRADARPKDSRNYTGVKGPVRKKVGEVTNEAYARFLKGDTTAIPHWMQIREDDSTKQREKKQRALKAFKKKVRFELKDMQSAKQANDWKSFMTGKGTKKKAGFMTGTKKESIFAVPDNFNSKVGVVGSGRGMTNAQTKKARLDF